MKKIVFFSSLFLMIAFGGCNPDPKKENNGKIKLAFQPVKDKAVKISYSFSVNSKSSNSLTNFYMTLIGKGETAADGAVILELKNESIKMDGTIEGNKVNGAAGATDTLTGDARLVSMPVFTLYGKSYRSSYDPGLNKKWEVQTDGDKIVDSTENKMQLLVRYADHEVGVGDSWEKNLVIKAGNKMNCIAKYTLNEVKGDSAIISVEGKLYGKGESFGNEFTIDGTLKGTFTVDVATGWPLSTNIDQHFTLKLGDRNIPMQYSIESLVVSN
ncbi:MAG: hypothetical protein JWP12_2797 [Bacteroidetes bacterium]|nr:hypothetical protein [Bacteroidota bacterium]